MSSSTPSETSPSALHSVAHVERSVARYLLAIARVGEPDCDRVSAGRIRDYLEVSSASVSEMVSKLDDRGLVDHEKYRGVVLTERGAAVASEVGWRLCVVSTFFDAVLDTKLDESMAFDIGHALSGETVLRLHDRLESACLGLCPTQPGDADNCTA